MGRMDLSPEALLNMEEDPQEALELIIIYLRIQPRPDLTPATGTGNQRSTIDEWTCTRFR